MWSLRIVIFLFRAPVLCPFCLVLHLQANSGRYYILGSFLRLSPCIVQHNKVMWEWRCRIAGLCVVCCVWVLSVSPGCKKGLRAVSHSQPFCNQPHTLWSTFYVPFGRLFVPSHSISDLVWWFCCCCYFCLSVVASANAQWMNMVYIYGKGGLMDYQATVKWDCVCRVQRFLCRLFCLPMILAYSIRRL